MLPDESQLYHLEAPLSVSPLKLVESDLMKGLVVLRNYSLQVVSGLNSLRLTNLQRMSDEGKGVEWVSWDRGLEVRRRG